MTALRRSPEKIRLPRGFSFSAVATGIKVSGRPDLALVEAANGANAVALFTKNRDRRPFLVDAEARLAGFVATEAVTRRGARTGEASALRQEAAVVEPRFDPMPTVDLNVLRLIHRSPPL